MTLIYTFTDVRMASGPNMDIRLYSYGETPDYGRWMLKSVDEVQIPLQEVHVSEQGSRRSELNDALDAYFGFAVNLHDLASPPPAGSGAGNTWPNTWSRP